MKLRFSIILLILIGILSSCAIDNSSAEESSSNILYEKTSKEDIYSSFEELFSDIEETSTSLTDDESSKHYTSDDSYSDLSCESSVSTDDAPESQESSLENSDVEISNNENNNSDDSSYGIFREPQSHVFTTQKGNSFETNCTDEDIISTMCEIADIASEYRHVTVYYTDVYQKNFFCYGGDNIHNTASTIKAPYAAYLLKSNINLSEIITLQSHHVQGGSGILKNMKIGTDFTVKELIKYMVTRSDNTAYAMLLEKFGTSGFRDYAAGLGLNFKIPASGYTTCTIREMAAFMLDIYNYQDTELGKLLIDYMKNCSYSLQIPKATSYIVAHKFGFIYEGKAFHDMGIVYAPIPYLELIFTKIDGTVYDTEAFIKIGKLVDKLNTQLSQNQ